jgi:hypothetical protein
MSFAQNPAAVPALAWGTREGISAGSGQEPEGGAKPPAPGDFVMAGAFDTPVGKLAFLLPAHGAQEGAQSFVEHLAAGVRAEGAIIEVHAGVFRQIGHSLQGGEQRRAFRGRLREVRKRSREADKIPEHPGMPQGGVEADRPAQAGSAKGAGAGIRQRAVMRVQVGEEFDCDKLRISRAAHFRREVEVAKCDVFVRVALGVANPDHDGLGQDAVAGEQVHPFVRRPVHAAHRTGRGVENIGPVMQHNHRETPVVFRGISLRQPDKQLPLPGQQAGVEALRGQPAPVAILPIGHGVTPGAVKPDLVGEIGGHIAMGIDGFLFPGAADDFVFEMRPGFRFDLARVERRVPGQPQSALRLPVAQSARIAREQNGLAGTVDGRKDLKTNFAHGGNSAS